MAEAFACTAKPVAQRAKKICAVMYVPIHEANTQNKSLKKLFHIDCYRAKDETFEHTNCRFFARRLYRARAEVLGLCALVSVPQTVLKLQGIRAARGALLS